MVYVTLMLAVCLVPVNLCKPLFTDREIQISKEQNPCHIQVSEASVTPESFNITDLHLQKLTGRIEGLQIKIQEAKDKIIQNGQIVETCVLNKFSNQKVNLSCTNLEDNDKKEMADCLKSTYQTISRFSMSLKEIEADKQSNGNGMLEDVISPLEEIELYSDQILCDIYIDLKFLGYNISFHKIPQRKNISLYHEFIEESKSKQFDDCFHVGSELNRIQMFHVLYQLLDTYTEALQAMVNVFSDTSLSSPSSSTPISTSTSSTRTNENNIDPVLIG